MSLFGLHYYCQYFFMYFYMFATGETNQEGGIKGAVHTWICNFKRGLFFRKLFLLAFFVVMTLCRMLINRNMVSNPLSDVMRNWSMRTLDSNYILNVMDI